MRRLLHKGFWTNNAFPLFDELENILGSYTVKIDSGKREDVLNAIKEHRVTLEGGSVV